ncbi:MAG: D-aminoacylase [Planctomycetes bacterium]|nr:D-aminoacylase [Planctomycetota bacterium]
MHSAFNMRARILLAWLCTCASAPAQDSRPAPAYDLLIAGGSVVDGSGAPARRADVAVSGARIAAVGELAGATARIVLRADGLAVAPGFVDVHVHADGDVLQAPRARNFVAMGVTTMITGNCGGSVTDLAKHLDAVAAKGVAVNYGSLIGAGTVREQVLRYARRAPRPEELARMQELVRGGMAAGAFGLSTGLIYVPGSYARQDELVALARVVAETGGVYASHIRSENDAILAAIDEALAIGKAAGIPVHVSHLKNSGKTNWGRSREVVERLRAARAAGQAVTGDVYAYPASSTGLSVLFPEAALEIGPKAFAERLDADPAFRKEMHAALRQTMVRVGFGDFSYAYLATVPGNPDLEGMTVAAAAELRGLGKDPDAQAELVLRLTAAAKGRRIGMVYHTMAEPDLLAYLAEPYVAIASDAGIRGEGSGRPHPRGNGNNPRVLGRYVREQKVLSLPEAVRRMTTLPCAAFGIEGRGRIAAGMFADLVVFDPAAVRDLATYEAPLRAPEGIPHVVVNGVLVVEQGRHTDALPGMVLRRNAAQTGGR